MITVETTVNTSMENAWDCWTNPVHIVKWYHASDDWYAPEAENQLKVDGKFRTKMAAMDGSAGFDFEGVYSNVVPFKEIDYSLADGRRVMIRFKKDENGVRITESFDPENENPMEMQRTGWQAILNNFRKYTESL